MRVTIVLLLLAMAAHTHAKKYTRCALAREFKCRYKFPSSQLADWVCLVKSESGYNTGARNTNRNGSRDYGLFQINDKYWCKSSSPYNECRINCSRLIDSNIADDVACAKKIYRVQKFNAWYGWKNKCRGRNLSSYIRGCNLRC